jgi:septation ring formation regulator EzrA
LKGKSPIEVAIELELRQPEVLDLYSEYLKLVQLDKLHSVYEEVKDDIEYFVKLYKMMKASGITPPHVERLVRIANDDLPSVERRFQLANNRVTELQGDIRNSTFTFQGLSDGISSMNATLRSLEAERQKVQEEIKELYQKRMKL